MSELQQLHTLLLREYHMLKRYGVHHTDARNVSAHAIARRFNITASRAYTELDAMLPHAQPTPSTSRTQEPTP